MVRSDRPTRARAPLKAGAAGERAEQVLAPISEVPDDLVELGYIGDAYGIRGWIKVQPHTGEGEGLLSADRWYFRRPGESTYSMAHVLHSRGHSGTVVAQLRGSANRTAAEALKGLQVWVPRSAFPTAGEDEFYWVDLIGAQVTNLQDEVLGKVVGLLDNGVHTVLRVAYETAPVDGKPAKTAERLIPFVGRYVQTVDVDAGRIVADWGLDY
ncbi:ribosome maturation factor RimM [Pandoraea nosoerga]|uniref:Ribosome maturation factor RimM n=1 Tax=Pandoraea nosoerga TaxID=2508296 RepID=A0A5E4TN03_9BURK|nr:ribosome maturation factor RimM [Pandoraea nosoerga]MBN4665518.1 ribosome maturation factor RimM [Pandoraea nosoerga]MBN4675043.1 ribosome maturation factor RimM [Pandoraea nosoerga]MBN4680359.1 ribosome maturation factor RimM [Pandoraea nosoerga]MBN4745563.1 ribosome maturation factor RimM [Pandoraea nosoerga]VVD87928.1 ribosome maturation factor RimM [Pandoraea nosoerga]